MSLIEPNFLLDQIHSRSLSLDSFFRDNRVSTIIRLGVIPPIMD